MIKVKEINDDAIIDKAREIYGLDEGKEVEEPTNY